MQFKQQDKKAISPQELFEKLMSGNYKQLQCVDEAATLRQERTLLLTLINQYKIQIEKRLFEKEEMEALHQKRLKVRRQLQVMEGERTRIEKTFMAECSKLKVEPVEQQQQAEWNNEVEEMRSRNFKIGMKIKEIHDYIFKLNQHNELLNRQKKSIELQTKHMCSNGCSSTSQNRLQALRKEQQQYEQQMRMKMRQRQQNSLLEMQHQEAEIQARNRRRMVQFEQRFGFV